jgi:hypothetical protein
MCVEWFSELKVGGRRITLKSGPNIRAKIVESETKQIQLKRPVQCINSLHPV